jgi:hypothetical protein
LEVSVRGAHSEPISSFGSDGVTLQPFPGLGSASIELSFTDGEPELSMRDQSGDLRVVLSVSGGLQGPVLALFPGSPSPGERATVLLVDGDGDPYIVVRDARASGQEFCIRPDGETDRTGDC